MARTSSRGDRHEVDAERAAERVSRGQRAEVSAGEHAPHVQRMCSECADTAREEELTLSRTASTSGEARDVPAEALAVLGHGGSPLEPALREELEPLYGHDLGAIRVHTGSEADRAARAVDAIAFAAGRDLVFRAGAFQPTEPAGRRLLAHELAHAVQQGAAPVSSASHIGLAGRDAEADAERAGERAAEGRSARVHASEPALARQLARMPVAPPPRPMRVAPARPALRVIPGGGGASPLVETVPSEPFHPTPYHEQFYAPDPWDQSLHAMQYRASVAAARDRVMFEGEQPIATLDRGGTAPDFTTPGPRQSSIGTFGHVFYDTHRFHLLDAMEHAIGRARSAGELATIYLEFIPEGPLYPALYGAVMGDSSGAFHPGLFRRWMPWGVRIPDRIDPGGVQRVPVFMAALAQRASAIPDLSASPLGAWLANEAHALATLGRGERSHGPCNVSECPRATCGGGNAGHDAFATLVTHGNPNELMVDTPEGISCQFDGEDLQQPGLLWEVKTHHEFLTELGMLRRGMSASVLAAIARLELQRMRCMFAASRCGYRYQYAFDDCEVARTFRAQWGNVPPVFYREFGQPRPCL